MGTEGLEWECNLKQRSHDSLTSVAQVLNNFTRR